MSNEFFDMKEIVGSKDILFLCIDCLRYDVAHEEEENGGTPVLNRYGKWRRCHAPGNFTYPSHQAMFAGFMPIDAEIRDMKKRESLFFSENVGTGRKAPSGAFIFKKATWVEELAEIGYETYCIGGVSFFNKRTELGSVLPSYFKHSYWKPSFGCLAVNSAKNQVDFAVETLGNISNDQRVMMYINFSALHYPNYFYSESPDKNSVGSESPGKNGVESESPEKNSVEDGDCAIWEAQKKHPRRDSIESHRMALRYVDREIKRLFDAFLKRGQTFVICCADHGTCYGEDGVWFHGVNHPIVNTVPYKHFILKD